MDDQPKRPGPKGPRMDHRTTTPAYRIIYGVFGSLAKFCRDTGVKPGTAHRWLVNGIIPAERQLDVIERAKAKGVEFDPALFVPTRQAA